MKELLDFLLKGLLGKEKFEIDETTDAGLPAGGQGRTVYTIKVEPDQIGMIIGRGGAMIKALRNILKVRATLEKTAVSLQVAEA